MVTVKLKESTKLKFEGRCDLLHVRLCDEGVCTIKTKFSFKDCVDEIFAGLMWLG